jgi:hypothetical protein
MSKLESDSRGGSRLSVPVGNSVDNERNAKRRQPKRWFPSDSDSDDSEVAAFRTMFSDAQQDWRVGKCAHRAHRIGYTSVSCPFSTNPSLEESISDSLRKVRITTGAFASLRD